MAGPTVNRSGSLISIGTTVRVEPGPPLRRRRATEESLSDAETPARYQEGAPDASGRAIAMGEMFSYLDNYAPPVWYLYFKREIGPDDARYQPTQEPDPNLPPLNPDSTNRTRYSYVFEEVGVYGTEDEAVEEGLRLAGGEA